MPNQDSSKVYSIIMSKELERYYRPDSPETARDWDEACDRLGKSKSASYYHVNFRYIMACCQRQYWASTVNSNH